MHWLDSFVFPEPAWVDVRDDRERADELQLELWRETRWTHPLASIVKKVAGSCPGTGEVVVMATKDRAVVVRLTWAGRNTKDGRPEWVACTSAEQLHQELERRPLVPWMDSLEIPERGWDDLRKDPERAAGLEKELRLELGKGDPRNDILVGVIASRWANDDIVVRTRAGAALVHLTWRGKRERPGWPEWADVTEEALAAELAAGTEGYDDAWFGE
jgi:hypothetical protein